MSKSDYSYFIEEHEKLIIAQDLNLGKMSVTNDIENVIEEIQSKYPNIDFQYMIYYDTADTWDAWDIQNERFILLNAVDLITAKRRLKEYEKN